MLGLLKNNINMKAFKGLVSFVVLFLLLIQQAMSNSYIDYSAGNAGGWITVKKISNAKVEVLCNVLVAVREGQILGKTHLERAIGDTVIMLRSYNSLGKYLTLKPQFVKAFYYTSAIKNDTAVSGYFFTKYYLRVFKCTVDISTQSFKNFQGSSRFVDFKCDAMNFFWNLGSMGYRKDSYDNIMTCPTRSFSTRVYLDALNVNESLMGFNHVAFTKFGVQDNNYDYGVQSYNPGAYGIYGDSLYFEFVQPESSLRDSTIKVIYNPGFSSSVPFSIFCLDSSNSCPPKPTAAKPQGLYLNSQTGDIVFVNTRYQLVTYVIRVHQFRKDSLGNWRYFGYVSLYQDAETVGGFTRPVSDADGIRFPVFTMPQKLDICEGDSSISIIKSTNISTPYKYVGSTDGNYPSSVLVDYSTGNSSPTFKLKVVAKTGDYSPTPGVVTLRVNGDSTRKTGEAARSTLVYIHKPLQPKMNLETNGCNNMLSTVKDTNSDIEIKCNWYVYKGTLKSMYIYSSASDTLRFNGMQADKYYVRCVVSSKKSSCTCSSKTLIDSIDMKQHWPGLDFDLNRKTVCLNDSSKFYIATGIKKFKGKVKYVWDADSMLSLKDTFFRSFSGPSSLRLTLKDDSGCMYTKQFELPLDGVYGLKQESQLFSCRKDTLTLGAFQAKENRYYLGKYVVYDALNNVEFAQIDSLFSYYYQQAKYRVESEFISDQGCETGFTTTISIDTTELDLKNKPAVLCKGMQRYDVDQILGLPKGGTMNHDQGGGSGLKLDTFGKYPHRVILNYAYENPQTQCKFNKEDTIWVVDTVETMASAVPAICKEQKQLNMNQLFGVKNTKGKWVGSTKDLDMDSSGRLSPRNSKSQSYRVWYFVKDGMGCDTRMLANLEIKTAVLDVVTTASPMQGNSPQKVDFTASNRLGNAAVYKWKFGDNGALGLDTGSGAVASYVYLDSGRFYPRVIAEYAGCADTIEVGQVKIGNLGVVDWGKEMGIMVYPNPIKAGEWGWLRFGEKGRAGAASGVNVGGGNGEFLEIIGINGAVIHRVALIEMQQLVHIQAPESGIYFIRISSSPETKKWVVE